MFTDDNETEPTKNTQGVPSEEAEGQAAHPPEKPCPQTRRRGADDDRSASKITAENISEMFQHFYLAD